MSRTVVAALRERLPADTFDEIARELPPEYDDLLARDRHRWRGTVGS